MKQNLHGTPNGSRPAGDAEKRIGDVKFKQQSGFISSMAAGIISFQMSF